MPLTDTERAAILADLAAIKARANAATKGPWFYNSYSGIFSEPLACADDDDEGDDSVAWVPAAYGDTAVGRHVEDAAFIAASRADVPRLIGYVERLLGETTANPSANQEG